jgi:hypothetical protein
MDFTYLKKTDADLAELAKSRSTTREAKREIKRRKLVGFWDGTAQIKWKLEPEWEDEEEEEKDEQASEETVY